MNDLSFEALGVLTFAQAHPDLPLTVSLLMERGCKEHTARRILRELRDAGHIESEQFKGTDGRFIEMAYGLVTVVDTVDFIGTDEIVGTEENYRTEDFSAPVEGAPAPVRTHERGDLILNLNTNTKPTVPDGTERGESPVRPRNDWYDAVFAVWHYTGALNGAMQKMLRGVSTDPKFRAGNVAVDITPDDLLAWATWYRQTQLRGDPDLNMLEDRLKIASSIAHWHANVRNTNAHDAQAEFMRRLLGPNTVVLNAPSGWAS